jgi:hypothetical protein
MALTLTGGNLNGGRELGRISGPLLSADLRRNGVNLAVDTDKLYLNVVNKYVGFGTNTPTRTLTAPGNSRFASQTPFTPSTYTVTVRNYSPSNHYFLAETPAGTLPSYVVPGWTLVWAGGTRTIVEITPWNGYTQIMTNGQLSAGVSVGNTITLVDNTPAAPDLIVTTQAEIGNLTFNDTDKIQNFTNNNIIISPAAGDQLVTFNGLGSTGYFAFLNNALTGTTNTEINISPTGKTIIGSTTPAASLSFSSNSYLSLSAPQTIGTQAYTFECFFYTASNGLQTILGASATGGMSIWLLGNGVSPVTTIQIDRSYVDAAQYTVNPITINTWHHIAVTRDSANNMSVFLDGVKATGSVSNTANYTGPSGLIGAVAGSAYFFTGYLTQIKLTVGSNYYNPTAASISVPTASLTTSANTKLLLIVANSGTFLTDLSGTQTISNIDGVIFSTAGPFLLQQNTGVFVEGNLRSIGNITFDGNIFLGNDDTDNITFAADVNSDLIPKILTVIADTSEQLITENLDLIITEDDQNLFTDTTSIPYLHSLGSSAKNWNNIYSQNLTVVDLFSTTATAGTWTQSGLTITGNSVSAGTGTFNITISGTGKVNLHNKVYIKDNTITHNNAVVPLEIGATGVGYVKFGGTRGLVIPKGTTLQRPAAAELGTIRYNNDVNYIEVYANVSNTQVVSLSTNSVTATAGSTQILTTNTVGFNVGDFISSTTDLFAFASGAIITAVVTNTSITINTPLLATLASGSNLTSQRKWIPIIGTSPVLSSDEVGAIQDIWALILG